MIENSIEYSLRGHIAYITFKASENGPQIAEICAAVNGDENIYVVVVQAEGDFWRKAADLPPAAAGEMAFLSPSEAIGSINRPTLASLNGDVSGAGLEIALACDLRIALEDARLGLPQIGQGRIPTQGGTQRLARLVGKGKAMEMVLTGETITSSEALEIGLVNQVVKAADLPAVVDSLADTLCTKAPLAVRYCKEAVNKGLDLTLEQGLRLEADLYFLLHTTSDRTEGVQSYLQKRQPQYRGQ
jgi:enoyl-CoA hydratase/carnithine racemase